MMEIAEFFAGSPDALEIYEAVETAVPRSVTLMFGFRRAKLASIASTHSLRSGNLSSTFAARPLR